MRPLLLSAALLTCCLAVAGRPAEDRVDYLRDVKPILAARCFACHGALQQKGGLRLDTAAAIREGGNRGPAAVPGKSGASPILDAVLGRNGLRRMPPPSDGEALHEPEVARLRAWIDQGATGPADEKPEPDPRDHWAFRPPLRPPVPGGAGRNSVDAFLDAGLASHGLKPQPPADPMLLLRRVYLDLIGLPPERAELEAFARDPSPEAYERIVDRLLASPAYGERWARHWMDVWRYSDAWGLGAEVRNSQKHLWHWRDWIIEALNADKGYDQMVREMLAADELYPTDLDRLRATGYLVRPYFLFNRTTWLDEVVEHTGKAFLGLTTNCAKCHDHKYDPIAQADYYRFRAFFEPYQVRTDEAPGEPDLQKDGIPRAFDCNLTAPTFLFVRGDDRRPVKERPLTPGLPRVLTWGDLQLAPVELPPEAHQPGLRPFVLADHLQAAEQKIAAARAALDQARAAVAAAGKAPGPAPFAAGARTLAQDDFAAARPELWEMGPGQWRHEGGRLLQDQDGDARAVLRLKQSPPADFQARFRFTTLGGRTWKSVGLSFDVAGENEVLVYLSAFAGGAKVQVAYKQGGGYAYPADGQQARPVEVNQPQELIVRVRGPLVQVEVNGEPALTYRLPLPRKPGRLELITFDAKAAFQGFALAALPPDQPLASPGAKAVTTEQARLAEAVAVKALAVAEAGPPTLKARAAADRDRGQARAAARAEKDLAALEAEAAVARAELAAAQALGPKKAEADKQLAAARKSLEAARKAAENPGETYTPLRGAAKARESNVEPEASLNQPFPATSTGRRSALALWLTDRRHPLTARVAVNHVWARHFGRPLVATVFDFGRKGAAPTHPELLDWLAVEFMEHGWSMKHLHRLLVTSAAYRRTSSAAGAAASVAADAENRWYWRMNPVRMEAQVVRDTLLALAGDLDPSLGGPSIPVTDQASRRRSLYFVHSHNDHHKFLSTFDDASVLECYRRAESIVPQQALALANSDLALAGAAKIAARLGRELGPVDDVAFARAAFVAVLAWRPNAEEQAACEAALRDLAAAAKQAGQADPGLQARIGLVHALLNHNDFITRR